MNELKGLLYYWSSLEGDRCRINEVSPHAYITVDDGDEHITVWEENRGFLWNAEESVREAVEYAIEKRGWWFQLTSYTEDEQTKYSATIKVKPDSHHDFNIHIGGHGSAETSAIALLKAYTNAVYESLNED